MRDLFRKIGELIIRTREKYLFKEHGWHAYSKYRKQQVRDDISELSEEALENSDDALQIIFLRKHRIPKIKLGDVKRKKGKEIEKDVSHRRGIHHPMKNKVMKKGRRIKVEIPYKGEKELFKVTPSTNNTFLNCL